MTSVILGQKVSSNPCALFKGENNFLDYTRDTSFDVCRCWIHAEFKADVPKSQHKNNLDTNILSGEWLGVDLRKHTPKRDWTTCSKYANHPRPNSSQDWRDRYDNLMSTRILTLVMDKTFTWNSKNYEATTGTIWIW